ncbi:MAG: SIMPL domain-containing protein [Methanomicrobiales archaeon]|nr:SIMPL domain-containing protein [Methanomicrobiales archaeon]
MMQKIVLCSLAVILVLSAVLGSAMAQDNTTSSEKLIHTSTTGEVLARPDQVEISLAVQTEDANAQVAQRRNADLMASTFAALERAGIPADQIKTTGYNIYPVYDSTGSILGQKIRLYRVTNTLQVTLTDTSSAGEILDLGVANGVNQVNYISFTLSETQQKALRSEALRDAMVRSRSDADAVASAGGLTITGIKEIIVSGGYYPVAVSDYRIMDGAGSAPTPVVPGDVTVTASVTVTYLCS